MECNGNVRDRGKERNTDTFNFSSLKDIFIQVRRHFRRSSLALALTLT